MPIPGMHV